jgi:hypothetical protein
MVVISDRFRIEVRRGKEIAPVQARAPSVIRWMKRGDEFTYAHMHLMK